jgi:hypothetical protein
MCLQNVLNYKEILITLQGKHQLEKVLKKVFTVIRLRKIIKKTSTNEKVEVFT